MIEIAKKAALEAGKEVLLLRSKGLSFRNKKRLADFVTDADIASEKIILEKLQQNFSRHNFLSEEIGKIDNQSNYTWVIDPLDGTIPFSSGLPIFGISIGLLKNNQPILGVINMPELNNLFWAERKKGAFLNGKRIYVSKNKELLKSVIGFEVGYVGGRRKQVEKLLSPMADKVRYPLMLGCASAGVAFVSSGVLNAYLHTAHPWDFLAGAVIVKEAGGKVTDFQGKPIDWAKDWISLAASNGLIHDKILNLIEK